MLPLGTAAFLAFGVLLVLLGANQADLARDLDLDLTRSGLLGSALALGIGVGLVGAGPIFDRYPRRPLFVGSTLLVGLSLVFVDASMDFGRAVAHVMLAGVGAGAYDTLINAAIVERFGDRAAKPMSAVHSAATLGAMLGPFAIGWIAAEAHWTASFQWTGAAHLALAAAALFTKFPAPEPSLPRDPALPGEATAGGPVLSTALLPLAWIAFAYVGVEAAMTIFAIPYASGGLLLGADRGRIAISAFWCGLFVGRLGLLAVRGSPGAQVLIAAGVTGAATLAIGVGWIDNAIEVLFGIVGVALGAVYPLMMTLTGQRFPHARGMAAGLVGAAGALGGLCIPWLTGAIGDGIGIVPAVATLACWSLSLGFAAMFARGPGRA